MKIKSIKFLSMLAASATLGLSAQATDSKLVQTLVEKGYLTAGEARSVSADYDMHTMETVAVDARAAHTNMLTFDGLLEVQYNYGSTRDRYSGSDVNNPPSYNNFSVPYARLGVLADLDNGWKGYLNLDLGSSLGSTSVFEGSNPGARTYVDKLEPSARLHKLYIEKAFDMATLRAAYQKVSFLKEFSNGRVKLKPVNYSIVSNYFTKGDATENTGQAWQGNVAFADRHAGVFLTGMFENFKWGVSVTNGYKGLKTPSAHTRNELGIYGNVGYEGDWEEILLEIGVNLGYQTEGNTNWFTATNTALPRNSVFGWNPFLVVNWQDFRVLFEVAGANIKRGRLPHPSATATQDARPWGLIVTPSYRYNEEWEFVFRLAHLNTDKRGVTVAGVFGAPSPTSQSGVAAYEKATTMYLGFNYYVLGNDVKLSGGYEYGIFKNLYSSSSSSFTNDKAYAHNIAVKAQLLL